jgi:hypothetical protein
MEQQMICSTCQKETESKNGHHASCFRPQPGDAVAGRNFRTATRSLGVSVYLWTVVRIDYLDDRTYHRVVICKPFGETRENLPELRFKARDLRAATQEEIAEWVAHRIRGGNTWNRMPFYVDEQGRHRLDLGHKVAVDQYGRDIR